MKLEQLPPFPCCIQSRTPIFIPFCGINQIAGNFPHPTKSEGNFIPRDSLTRSRKDHENIYIYGALFVRLLKTWCQMKDINQGFHVINFVSNWTCSITDFSNILPKQLPSYQKLDKFRVLALPNYLVTSTA